MSEFGPPKLGQYNNYLDLDNPDYERNDRLCRFKERVFAKAAAELVADGMPDDDAAWFVAYNIHHYMRKFKNA